MYVLPLQKRAEVISHLCEGAGIRATSRLTGVSQPTILNLLLKVGAGCDRLHDRLVRDLDIREIQVDEIWSYVQKKQARVQPTDDPTWGDAFTYLGLARTQKLVIAYRVGKRNQESTDAFMADLRARLVTVPSICTDGFAAYEAAVGQNFEAVDYAQVVKNYSRSPRRVRDGQPSDHRYEPARDPFCVRTPKYGNPDPRRISTSHVERLNLDVRMMIRRMTRLCNGFSRKLTHHTAAVSLFVSYVNLVRIHGALRVTPAIEAGIAEHVWTVEELVAAALDAAGEPVAKPLKKPLRMPVPPPGAPAPAVRELPSGRGFLRLVSSGAGGPAPTPGPQPSPAAPAQPAPSGPTFDASGQGDLFSWRPTPREPVQLTLFD